LFEKPLNNPLNFRGGPVPPGGGGWYDFLVINSPSTEFRDISSGCLVIQDIAAAEAFTALI